MLIKGKVFSFLTLIFLVISFLQENRFAMTCGVGKGSYTNKDYAPFSKYQQKPDEDEESSIASGPFSHKIRIRTEEFRKKIVRYFGTNVIFRDDEGNGSDRYMTKVSDQILYVASLNAPSSLIPIASVSSTALLHRLNTVLWGPIF